TGTTSVLRLPQPVMSRIWQTYPEFDAKIPPIGLERFQAAPTESGRPACDNSQGPQVGQLDLMTMATKDLMTTGPITCASAIQIRDAARLMRQHDISCLPVVDDGNLVGMLTDGDLRDRVLAEAISVERPVAEVMTPDPITIQSDALAFDALVTMMQRAISHLPVLEDGKLVGVLTHTNLIHAQSRSAVYMIGEIHRLKSAHEIGNIVSGIPELLVTLVQSGATAEKIGHIISSIADAATVRLLRLAEEDLGPPPVPYLWLACGSQG
ncbi:MAG: CBS domain-containing protein, partial [Pseudomonadota bacterium]